MSQDQIEREIVINAPVGKVWAAITQADHIGTWFGNAGATIDLRPGGEFTCTWRDGDTVDTVYGVVEKVDEPHLFAYRWASPPGARPAPGNCTLVEFTLEPAGDGTRLRVVESGFQAVDLTEADQAALLDDHAEGWRQEFDDLRTHLQP